MSKDRKSTLDKKLTIKASIQHIRTLFPTIRRAIKKTTPEDKPKGERTHSKFILDDKHEIIVTRSHVKKYPENRTII